MTGILRPAALEGATPVLPDGWEMDVEAAILVDPAHPQAMEWRAALMAQGIEVFLGPDDLTLDEAPLVVVPAESRHRPDVAGRMDRTLAAFPDARVCFVTGTAASDVFAACPDAARLRFVFPLTGSH
ncbi:hypothetical protein E7811_15480 [Aliigemmobacter aestuarii]|uniref:Uncharacterized protein n=1 Tax=Aliigemmobacter aestuarii TaxID=1445661 RepID=A0A4S3MKF0_9RHOB|nr:hypothetical protein [Gemmobacter aestuarii]THD82442.1 hypothetical protein E7811_15480 [Gemmobacter aestuarii]